MCRTDGCRCLSIYGDADQCTAEMQQKSSLETHQSFSPEKSLKNRILENRYLRLANRLKIRTALSNTGAADTKKRQRLDKANRCREFVASLGGFEPPAFRLGGERSILLSYRDIKLKSGLFPWFLELQPVLRTIRGPVLLMDFDPFSGLFISRFCLNLRQEAVHLI